MPPARKGRVGGTARRTDGREKVFETCPTTYSFLPFNLKRRGDRKEAELKMEGRELLLLPVLCSIIPFCPLSSSFYKTQGAKGRDGAAKPPHPPSLRSFPAGLFFSLLPFPGAASAQTFLISLRAKRGSFLSSFRSTPAVFTTSKIRCLDERQCARHIQDQAFTEKNPLCCVQPRLLEQTSGPPNF